MSWYAFKPADTLLFKDASSANKGEDHSAGSLFPPAESTILGALRTTMLVQAGVSFKDYYKGAVDAELLDIVGNAGEKAPFQLYGFMLKKGKNIYVPTPYHWFGDKDSNGNEIYVASHQQSTLFTTEDDQTLWVKGRDSELENMGGNWILLEDFQNPRRSVILPLNDFYYQEIRTGNALDKARNVIKGHLYSFSHIRLREDVALLFGINRSLRLKKEGLLTLGGEKRFGRYWEIDPPSFPSGKKGLYMTLTPVEANDYAFDNLVATGKLLYRGGWDLHKGFHKPMRAFYPAGSVFKQKISENCIQL